MSPAPKKPVRPARPRKPRPPGKSPVPVTYAPKRAETVRPELELEHAGELQVLDSLAEPLRASWDLFKSNMEREWALQLEAELRAGTIETWRYEPMTFKVGPELRYTPDFLVVRKIPLALPGGGAAVRTILEFHEIKGWAQSKRASRVAFRSAAHANPWFAFFWITRKQRAWQVEPYQPAA